MFLAVAAVMATIGEGVARTFIQFRPPDAYRLDIGGRIAGIAAFSLLSFLDAKPVTERSSSRRSCYCCRHSSRTVGSAETAS